MIPLSLHTGGPREAYILVRKLTADSDRIYDGRSRNLVSDKDLHAFPSQVSNVQLDGMRRVAPVTRMDLVSSSESNGRGDWATAQAWTESNPENAVRDLVSFSRLRAIDWDNRKKVDAGGTLDLALSGPSATLLARK